jgi:hypothetical protein
MRWITNLLIISAREVIPNHRWPVCLWYMRPTLGIQLQLFRHLTPTKYQNLAFLTSQEYELFRFRGPIVVVPWSLLHFTPQSTLEVPRTLGPTLLALLLNLEMPK